MKDSGGTEDDVVNTVLKQEVTSLDLAVCKALTDMKVVVGTKSEWSVKN